MAAIPILRVFLSTLSLRRATSSLNQGADTGDISIHALLAESDAINGCNPDFEGISIHALLAESDDTSSLMQCQVKISIHALLAESDNRDIAHGERQKNISIHALLAESDARS